MNSSAHYALPFNSHAPLSHLHDRAVKNGSERRAEGKKTRSKAAGETEKPRESSGAKFSRKMQSLFAGRKEREPSPSHEDAETQEQRKKGLLRRLVGNDAMLHARSARFGRF